MPRISDFEYFLRTGRARPIEEQTEQKFNGWHDPDDGRFTFVGQGRFYSGGPARMSKPATARAAAQSRTSATPKPIRPAVPKQSSPKASTLARSGQSTASRQPEPGQDSATTLTNISAALDRTRREMGTAGRSLRAIPAYPESGSSTWRAANDQVFIEAANKFNRERGLKPGNPKYMDPLLLKAWAMMESGGSKSAFLRDPLQVNNPGDFNVPKPQVTGLTKNQQMSPATSVEAALKWLEFRGHLRNKQHQPGPWIGIEGALQRYNARTDLHKSGVPFSVWYARQVLASYDRARKPP